MKGSPSNYPQPYVFSRSLHFKQILFILVKNIFAECRETVFAVPLKKCLGDESLLRQ